MLSGSQRESESRRNGKSSSCVTLRQAGTMTKKYWPFEVDESSLDVQGKSQLDFLKSCSSLGCESYMFGAGNFGASATSGRIAEIFVRGTTRWEVVLAELGDKKSAEFVSTFDEGKRIAIEWLDGVRV